MFFAPIGRRPAIDTMLARVLDAHRRLDRWSARHTLYGQVR
jgi:hypothetical protein